MSENSEAFNKAALGMGLETAFNPLLVRGNYRSHYLAVYEAGLKLDEVTLKTNYDVEFENPQPILLNIRRRSISTWLTQPLYSWNKNSREIKIDDFAFDGKFSVRGNRESNVRAVLDQPIREEIMKIEDFNLRVGWTQIEIPWMGFRRVFVTNLARYVTAKPIKDIKEDAEEFKTIVDAIIDIVEKLEPKTKSSR